MYKCQIPPPWGSHFPEARSLSRTALTSVSGVSHSLLTTQIKTISHLCNTHSQLISKSQSHCIQGTLYDSVDSYVWLGHQNSKNAIIQCFSLMGISPYFSGLFVSSICFSFASEILSLRQSCPAFTPAGVTQRSPWLQEHGCTQAERLLPLSSPFLV